MCLSITVFVYILTTHFLFLLPTCPGNAVRWSMFWAGVLGESTECLMLRVQLAKCEIVGTAWSAGLHRPVCRTGPLMINVTIYTLHLFKQAIFSLYSKMLACKGGGGLGIRINLCQILAARVPWPLCFWLSACRIWHFSGEKKKINNIKNKISILIYRPIFMQFHMWHFLYTFWDPRRRLVTPPLS